MSVMPLTMRAPTLTILASLALGFACQRRPSAEDFAAAQAFPFRTKMHEEEDSFTRDNLGFKAWPVTAADGGLVGVAAEIHNLSKDQPLRMRSITGSIPIGILLVVLRGRETDILVANPIIPLAGHQAPPDPPTAGPGHPSKYPLTRWVLPASGVKRYFIPMRFFVRQLPTAERLEECTLHVSLGAYPDWIPEDSWEPPFSSLSFPKLVLTKATLHLDYRKALAEALGRVGKVKAAEYVMPDTPP